MPKVLNARGTGWTDDTLPPNSVYVGRHENDRRRGGGVRFKRSKWANKFPIPQSATDDERRVVIAQYRAWLLLQPELMAALPELRGKDLICWCAKKPCHADVLLELANAA
jgi:hypothetical protein